MRRTLSLAALLAAFIVGCGGSPSPPSPPQPASPPPFICQPKVPAQAGECIRQEQRAKGFQLVAPLTSSAPSQGVDISNWQGVPDFGPSRVKFVLIQTNDGNFHNPFLGAQVEAAYRAHIPFGFYTFTEAFSGEAQAATALALGQHFKPALGYWSDVEVNGAYGQACPYVNRVKRAGARIAGVYSSPGLYFAGRCAGYDWPAEWSSGRAIPLSGYSLSATKVRQWCGTCRLAGFSGQVDRDESLGLLSLVTPPKPVETPSQRRARERRELAGHQSILRGLRARILVLRHVESHYGCTYRRRRHEHLTRTCIRWFGEGDTAHRKGRYEIRAITKLRRALA